MKPYPNIARAILPVVLLAAAGLAHTQELRIGVVDFDRLLQNAPQAQTAMRTLREEFAPREREVRAQEEQLQTLEERLQQGEGLMGEEERRELEREHRDLQRELNRKKQEVVEDINLRRNEELGRLQRLLVDEVQSYAQAQGYDIVVSRAMGVVYADSSVDITEPILQALQQRGAGGGSN